MLKNFMYVFNPNLLFCFKESKILTIHSFHKHLNLISHGGISAYSLTTNINKESVIYGLMCLVFKLLICNWTKLSHYYVAV